MALCAAAFPAVWVRVGAASIVAWGGLGGLLACGLASGFPVPAMALQALMANRSAWRIAVGAGGVLAWSAGVHRPARECQMWSLLVACASASGGLSLIHISEPTRPEPI
eukprot:2180537-Pyramimonas_sp.AAC.1